MMTLRTRKRTCPTCGAPARGGLFCRMCGSRLEAGAPASSGLAGEWSPRRLRLAGMRDRARFAVGLLQTWSGARRQLGMIDAELRRLHGERQEWLLALGDATYRGDEEGAARTRDGIRALDEQIEQEHEKQRRVVEDASSRMDRERGYVAPTQVVDPEADETESAPKESS